MSTSIEHNPNFDGVPYVGKWALAIGQVLHIPYPFVVDTQQIFCDGGDCEMHPLVGSAAAFKTTVPAGVVETYLGRSADLFLTNVSGVAIEVSVVASQTRIPRSAWVGLDNEGRSAHTGVTVT